MLCSFSDRILPASYHVARRMPPRYLSYAIIFFTSLSLTSLFPICWTWRRPLVVFLCFFFSIHGGGYFISTVGEEVNRVR